jgi:hypothetical protein
MFKYADTYSFDDKIIIFLSKEKDGSYKFRNIQDNTNIILNYETAFNLQKIRIPGFFYQGDSVLIKLNSGRNIRSEKNVEIKLEKGFSMKNQILNVYINESKERVYSFDISKDHSDYAELICKEEELILN